MNCLRSGTPFQLLICYLLCQPFEWRGCRQDWGPHKFSCGLPPPHHTHMMGAESTSDIQWLPGFLLTENESSITRRGLFVLISFVAQMWRWAVSEALAIALCMFHLALYPGHPMFFNVEKYGLGTRLTEHYIKSTPHKLTHSHKSLLLLIYLKPKVW